MSNYQHERGWLDSDVWGNAPYSEREAWSWMIGEAAWRDTTVNVKGHPVKISRGDLTSSLRFMAAKWQWSKNKVDRYLSRLKSWGMIKIGTESGTGQNVITICNYDRYQEKSGKGGTESGTRAGQERDASGTNKKPITNQLENIHTPDGVSETVWKDFLKIRKAKRSPITETALNGIRKEAQKLGWPLERALSECCSRGWQSFKAEWVSKDNVRPLQTKAARPIQPSLAEAMSGYDF